MMEAMFEKIFPGNRCGGPSLLWVAGNTVLYYTAACVLLLVTLWIPASNTGKSARKHILIG